MLQGKLHDIELGIRGLLRGFGLKVGQVSKGRYEARVRELATGHSMLEPVTAAMLQARASLQAEYGKLHRLLLRIVKQGGTHHHVADLADPACPIDLAGLILAWRQTKIRPEIFGPRAR